MFPTTISSWVLLIWKALESYERDPRAVFDRVGLDYRQLNDSNARYPIARVQMLWKEAVADTQDPCFGLRAAQFWHPTTFHALGYSWMASASLKEALGRLSRYIRIVNSGIRARLVEHWDSYEFLLDIPNGTKPAPASAEAALAIVVDMCRQSYGRDFAPVKVTLAHQATPCADHLANMLGAPVQFDAAGYSIVFDRNVVAERLPTGNPELARANDRIAVEYIAHLDRQDVSAQVKAKLVELLPSGQVSEERMANELNLSLRTLQRKLAEQGTTYTDLLDETRRELATQYVTSSLHSINEITYLLGFSEPSNFSRAFKRWMGVSPKTYRLSL